MQKMHITQNGLATCAPGSRPGNKGGDHGISYLVRDPWQGTTAATLSPLGANREKSLYPWDTCPLFLNQHTVPSTVNWCAGVVQQSGAYLLCVECLRQGGPSPIPGRLVSPAASRFGTALHNNH